MSSWVLSLSYRQILVRSTVLHNIFEKFCNKPFQTFAKDILGYMVIPLSFKW